MSANYTLTGTFQQLTGIADATGQVILELANYGTLTPKAPGVIITTAPITATCVAGAFTITFWGNDQITPAGTYYTVRLLTSKGQLVSDTTYQFVGGGSHDLSTVSPLSSTPPTPVSNYALNNSPAFTGTPSSGALSIPGQVNQAALAGINGSQTLVPVAATTSSFDIADTATSFSADESFPPFYAGLSAGLQVIPSSDNSAALAGGVVCGAVIPTSSTKQVDVVAGLISGASNAGTGPLTGFLSGNYVQSSNWGTASAVYGSNIECQTYGGTTDAQAGIFVNSELYGGAITDCYGIYIAGFFGGLSPTNNYGLWIDDQTQGGINTNPWSIWTDGGKHHLGGAVEVEGPLTLAPATGAPTSAGTAGTAGQIITHGGFLYFCSVTGVAGSATWNKLSMTSV